MKAETNELIRNYAAGFSCIETAIRGVSDEELDFKPSPDAWSVKEILIHLADAELVVVDRMKRIIAEDAPPMRTMYQELWARRLHYGKLDHE
ncbi:MAG TPA: DinB family protein, partial [Paenibacillus sp.]|nr:DinB family protein [Paenibacillus sp.]